MKFTSTALTLTVALTFAALGCGKDTPKPAVERGTGGSSGAGDAGTSDASDASDATGPTAPDYAALVTCTGVKDKTKPITPAAGRKVYCAIDLGSNNLKLQVISMEANTPLSFKDERACRVKTEFGKKVYDAETMTPKPLPEASITDLIAVINELARICTLDGGQLVGAEATQWARWATNIADVKTRVMAGTGHGIDVLTPELEGAYGYVAATRNAPEKISLDPGSNSFQIGWLPKGATTARTVSVPFGYVLAAGEFYKEATPDSYPVAQGKHVARLKILIDQELAKLSPPSSLADVKAAIAAGNLKKEIFIVGQDGALHLSVRAQLRDAQGKWIDNADDYQARVAMEQPMANPSYGDITTTLTPADVTTFLTEKVKDADFAALRSAKVRAIYGEKALANTVMLDFLIRELGLETIVLVPQEMPAGYILAKIK